MTDRRTKAQLVERMEELEAHIRSTRPGPQVKPEPPAPEGVAVSVCIAALEKLTGRQQYSGASTADGPAIGRVLRLLAARYEVPLVEVRYEPCSRAHVDQISSFALQNAIESAVQR